jgi:hypothetical protein
VVGLIICMIEILRKTWREILEVRDLQRHIVHIQGALSAVK